MLATKKPLLWGLTTTKWLCQRSHTTGCIHPEENWCLIAALIRINLADINAGSTISAYTELSAQSSAPTDPITRDRKPPGGRRLSARYEKSFYLMCSVPVRYAVRIPHMTACDHTLVHDHLVVTPYRVTTWHPIRACFSSGTDPDNFVDLGHI